MRNLYFVILALLALLIGCSKQFLNDDNRLTITAFSTSFDTKASETAFESGDVMGVFMENNASNLRYETSDGVSWKGYGNLGEFKSGENVIAYYPYSENATNLSAIEISDGVDFMITSPTAITVENNKASVALQFRHVLSKLVVNMEVPQTIDGLATAGLDHVVVKDVARQGVFDVTNDQMVGDLTDVGDMSSTNREFIIIPQTVSRIEFVCKMTDGTFRTLVHTKPIKLTKGTKTTLQAISNADLYFTSFLDLKNGDAQTDLPLSFYVAPGRTWTLTSSAAWLTFSATTGVGAATVKVSVTQNTGTPRTALLTLKDDKGAFAYLSVMQNYSKFELSAYAPNETVPKAGKAYTVNINSNKPWSVTSKTNVSVSPETGIGTTAVTITVAATAVSTTRSVSAVFATTNSTITRTWSGTQEASGPPVVNVGGTKWTGGNLTASSQGATSGFTVANPQDWGVFFKWGSKYAYTHPGSSAPSGHWGGSTTMAATSPSSGSGTGYDYVGLGGGAAPGDPCKELGAYRTPTHAQWQALNNSDTKWGTYKGVNGRFFGQSYSSCNNDVIAADCIFMPAAGYRDHSNGSAGNERGHGDYWSSSVYSNGQGWSCYFTSGGVYPDYVYYRGVGFSVRCVQE